MKQKKEKEKKRQVSFNGLEKKVTVVGKGRSTMNLKEKLVTLVEGDPKAPFSTATTLRCREGCYSIPWIAPLYPWFISYNAEY